MPDIKIRDEDISNLLSKVEQHLTEPEKAIFTTLVEVAKTSTYLVKTLSLDLKIAKADLAEVYSISDSVSVAEIAAAFANPDLNSFSERDAIAAIENMKGEMQKAENFQQTIKTILTVAKTFAPLLLV